MKSQLTACDVLHNDASHQARKKFIHFTGTESDKCGAEQEAEAVPEKLNKNA